MNAEHYIQRPQPTLVIQLTEADESEILTALAHPDITTERDSDGHWVFQAASGQRHEAVDGDWVAHNGYWIGAASHIRGHNAWQQVPSANVTYDVT